MTTLLRVSGEVEVERQLTFADLTALPAQVADVGALVPGRVGSAIELRAILDAVAVRPPATHVTLTATDGRFSASVPLAAVRDAVIVYRLGDEPLPQSQGGPLRLLIPKVEECALGGVDACANVKFLGEIQLTVGERADTRPTTTVAHEDLHRHER